MFRVPHLKPKTPVEMTIGIQRIIVLLPKEDQCKEVDQSLSVTESDVKGSDKDITVNCVHFYI